MAGKTLEISSMLDDRKIGRYQKLIIGLCAAVVFLDGFDAQAIGYVAPALIEAGVVTPGQLGPLFSIGLVGLMLGALFIAPLADRLGRRPVILASTILFGVFSLATAWATEIDHFMILRFLTGLGLGGCMPNAIALTSEYAPTRSRSLLVMIMFNGFTLGSLVGGLVSAQMVPTYGWNWVFLVGGVLPLLLVPVLYFMLPESLRFLVAAKAPADKIARLVRRVDPEIDPGADTRFVVSEESTARMSVRRLLSDGRAKRTILIWIVFFMSLLDVYMLVNWLPTMMKTVGAPIRIAILIGAILQLGGLIGAVPLGYILDRVGARRTMGAAYVLGAVSIALIGVFASTSIPLTVLVVFLAGFGVIGGQTAANAVAATSYPTEIRSTGVGWALGVGRVGSIVGPLLAGVLQTMHVTTRDIFFLSAIPAVIAAMACFGLGGGGRPAAKAKADALA
jgi:AAHS family 4-hydroxybenzoate transporter-like MFS transporter